MRALGVVLALAVVSCDHDRHGSSVPSDGSAVVEDFAEVQLVGDLGQGPACDNQHLCPPGTHCDTVGVCELDVVGCHDDNACDGDTYCLCPNATDPYMSCPSGGTCVPWGTAPRGPDDPSCESAGFVASQFVAPMQKCHWESTTLESGVLMTPLVVDLDGDKKPEIVFLTQNLFNAAPNLVAIHGDTCVQIWAKAMPATFAATGSTSVDTQLATADLDADGSPEIVAVGRNTVYVFDHLGNQLATGNFTPAVSWSVGPAIADIDGVAPPEIAVEGVVFRYTKGQAFLTQLFDVAPPAPYLGTMSALVDLDGDHIDELVTGNNVYNGLDGQEKTPSVMAGLAQYGAAFPAIADFNQDGKPDIALIASAPPQRTLTVVDYTNDKILFGPYTVTETSATGCGSAGYSGGCAGTTTIGDYDGDGVPDIGFATKDAYHVYALKCAASPKPVDCMGTEPGELWSHTTQDYTSGGTGSSTFDFNGDGIAEAVYRDECFLRVFNGKDGSLLFAETVTSGTLLEYPVIADVDNDGHADIVVGSDDNEMGGGGVSNCQASADKGVTFGGFTKGIFVFSDPMNRWMPSRPIWSEHTYHITEINDDLTVPTNEPANWLNYNSYRKNVQGAGQGTPSPDYTSGGESASNQRGDCSGSLTLMAEVCNRGATPSPAGVPGTFYDGDPRIPGATKICSTTATSPVAPGTCESVSCTWTMPPASGGDVWFRANDDGTQTGILAECKSGNDLVELPQYACVVVL